MRFGCVWSFSIMATDLPNASIDSPMPLSRMSYRLFDRMVLSVGAYVTRLPDGIEQPLVAAGEDLHFSVVFARDVDQLAAAGLPGRST